MTLNFDVAASSALASLGAGAVVSTVRGPDDYQRLGARNLVYLHRDINSAPDDLILRADALDEAWRDHWEEVVARRVLAGPVTVFVGLGSPAAILIETTRRILDAVGRFGASAYVVGPDDRNESTFFAELGLDPDQYIQLGWGDFMGRLAARLAGEHLAKLVLSCDQLSDDRGLPREDVANVCERLSQLGLVRQGRLRAHWLLESRPYVPL